MVDTFSGTRGGLESPASRAAAVTPHDTTPLAFTTRAIYVGGPGDVRVTTAGGDTVTYKNVSGQKVIRATHILATGTTATDIVAEW